MHLKEPVHVEVAAFVDIISVEREHRCFADFQSVSPQHPQLNGNIQNKLGFQLRRRLDFDQTPAAISQPLQDVDTCQDVFMLESRLK